MGPGIFPHGSWNLAMWILEFTKAENYWERMSPEVPGVSTCERLPGNTKIRLHMAQMREWMVSLECTKNSQKWVGGVVEKDLWEGFSRNSQNKTIQPNSEKNFRVHHPKIGGERKNYRYQKDLINKKGFKQFVPSCYFCLIIFNNFNGFSKKHKHSCSSTKNN